MKFYELILEEYDFECGTTREVLESSKNKKQMEDLSKKLNKKYGTKETKWSEYSMTIKFYVKEIDTSKVKDSLTQEDIKSITKRWEF